MADGIALVLGRKGEEVLVQAQIGDFTVLGGYISFRFFRRLFTDFINDPPVFQTHEVLTGINVTLDLKARIS